MARQNPPTHHAVELRAVVQGALDLTAYGLRSSGVEVEVAIADDLPDVMGDADQLTQLATNLIINAQHALQSLEGPRRLAISGTRQGTEARLVFADNGPGIPETIRSRIFDPFFTTKPLGSGTGIGLSLCQSIVRAHEGELICADTEGGGATFVVILASSPAGEDAVSDTAEKVWQRTPGTVLIVDDEREILEALREIIAPLVDRIDTAETGDEALRKLEAFRYDLLLTDLRMPALDGRGLYARLRNLTEGAPSSIVFMTGDCLSGDLQQFVRDTGLAVLNKPFTSQTVREVVMAALAPSADRRPTIA